MSEYMDNQQSHSRRSDLVPPAEEIWFLIDKDDDGYPESRTWEGLWSRPICGAFELLNVPFYLKNVSRGDLVKASDGGFLRFTEVIQRGGHNTYRLLMHEASSDVIKRAMSELEDKGLTVELNETQILLAVDVPPTVNQEEIDDYLIANEQTGRWQMQDGYLTDGY